jgi:SAM-dependent methyltransferase
MTTPEKERPSTYFVQERNGEELTRLLIQDPMITEAMGGVLPEQPDPASLRRALDIGCSSGSWVIETAQVFPTLSVFGIDISKRMVDYAHTQATLHQVSDRVEFQVMDALFLLEFPPEYFDLVNLRFGLSFMRTWDWPKMLSEMQRVVCRGGVVRVTDTSATLPSSGISPSFSTAKSFAKSAGCMYLPSTPSRLISRLSPSKCFHCSSCTSIFLYQLLSLLCIYRHCCILLSWHCYLM